LANCQWVPSLTEAPGSGHRPLPGADNSSAKLGRIKCLAGNYSPFFNYSGQSAYATFKGAAQIRCCSGRKLRTSVLRSEIVAGKIGPATHDFNNRRLGARFFRKPLSGGSERHFWCRFLCYAEAIRPRSGLSSVDFCKNLRLEFRAPVFEFGEGHVVGDGFDPVAPLPVLYQPSIFAKIRW
jgi:hypothetical protein